ncbi:MAG TPA: metal-dependent hydrolase [Thermoplasmatales archaeon]|nr:metal-dependent hydrolase [Thermoplasmatales archaeon]
MIILDNHLHLRRDGRFIDAVKDFQKAGGTHIILCQYPMVKKIIEYRSYTPCYTETIKMAEDIRRETNIKVYITVGPYPVDYLRLKEKFGREEAIDIMLKGMDEAAKLCEEKICIAIGEIGRPHFPVPEEVIDDSNDILRYGMEKAKDVDVPVVLHTEHTTPQQCKELVEMGRKVGLPASKIVKHYSPALIKPEENYGLMPSVLASRNNILEAASKGTRFLMETDYIDDPRRPGAVLGPKTVPKRTMELLREEILTEEEVMMIHKGNPEKTYGISMEL